ncbi:hypothetical protein GY45DRAFT_1320773 [Cubamyces sp. BRFM 1775]|nr:hypothetical protein GY45DRAFT_1320773 [Cubamyces sp. BRFM 1775]
MGTQSWSLSASTVALLLGRHHQERSFGIASELLMPALEVDLRLLLIPSPPSIAISSELVASYRLLDSVGVAVLYRDFLLHTSAGVRHNRIVPRRPYSESLRHRRSLRMYWLAVGQSQVLPRPEARTVPKV